jgi:hypothetical protein
MRLPIAPELPFWLPVALALAAKRVAIPILAISIVADFFQSLVALRSTTNVAPVALSVAPRQVNVI